MPGASRNAPGMDPVFEQKDHQHGHGMRVGKKQAQD